ncbi:MAG: tetratricopeptide repeat-containing sensor histidine kinase [Bacteroidetes bacterium]|nr:tetratricopeptide repeat-containing sensor histidine kinase [Bacteroidota bacterium]
MKVFFAFMVLWIGTTALANAQDDTDVRWFENLFVIPKNKSIDEENRMAEQRRRSAQETHDKKEEARVLIELGVLHLSRVNDYEQALGWLIRSLAIEDSLSLYHEKIFTYIAMARVFEEVGDYYKSADFLKEAKNLDATEEDLVLRSLILNESGRINAAHGNTEDAFRDYNQVLSLTRQLELRSREADALFNLGRLLTKQKKYNEALKSHKEALAIRRSLRDKSKEAMSLNEIGELYRGMKNYERAMANHVAALEIRQKLKDEAALVESYNNIGALYIGKKDYKRAIANLELALEAGRDAQDQEQTLKTYDYLSQCYKELKDYKKALAAKESSLGILDFIQHDKNERQLLETQNRYQMKKKEGEIDQLEQDREQREKVIEAQTKLRDFLFLLMAFGLIIVVLVLFLYLQKRRSNRKLQEINATKDKLFSIIGHDLKGPLNSLTAFSSLLLHHTDSLSKDEIKMLSLDLDKSLKNLFTLLENLLEWGRSQTGNIDFKAEDFDLAAVLKENQELLKVLAENKKITLVNNNPSPLPAKAHRHSINTVVRNLISNAIKFTPQGGSITLLVESTDKFLRVAVTDTGVGMSEAAIQRLFKIGTKYSTTGTAQEKGTGLGLVLCKDFVEKNGGTIGVDSTEGKGSTFYFTVPKG